MTPFGRSRLWFGLFILVVFLLGVVTGLGGSRFLHGPPFGRPPRPPSPAMIADRLTRELNLTPEQRKQVEVVLQQGTDRLERFHAETGDQYGKLRRELDADIERVLTPEQQAKYRTLRPGPPRDGRPPPPPPR